VPSIGTTLVGLGRPSLSISNRPPIHRGPIVERAISGTSMNRNTNVEPIHGFDNPPIQLQSSEGSHGDKRPLDARDVQTFYTGPTQGGSSRTPTSTISCRQDVDENSNTSKRRHLKRFNFVKTKIGNNVQIGLCNLTSVVEGEVPVNYGHEKQVLGDNEITQSDGTNHEEAPCDGDVIMPSVVTLDVGTLCIILKFKQHNRTSQ
jgi:hypothetical protein